MQQSIRTRISQMFHKVKASVQDAKARQIERKRVKALTRELISVVKNPDDTAVQKIYNLVRKGANVNIFDMDKECSLLHFAAKQNRMDVVKALVESGCKTYININDVYGKDPAFYAIDNNNPEMLDYLLSNGVSTARPADFNLISSFRHAVRSGHIDLVEIELKHGADINDHVGESFTVYGKYHKIYPGLTPLAEVVGGSDDYEQANGGPVKKTYDKAMIKFLLQKGARTDIKDDYGRDVDAILDVPEIKESLKTAHKNTNPKNMSKTIER